MAERSTDVEGRIVPEDRFIVDVLPGRARKHRFQGDDPRRCERCTREFASAAHR